MILEQMVYTRNRENQTIAIGTYKDHDYVVKSYGHFPCCYVSVKSGIDEQRIKCHGGVTWFGKNLPNEEPVPGEFWIGWDYAHGGDYICPYGRGKQWMTEELEMACEEVIDQLEGFGW